MAEKNTTKATARVQVTLEIEVHDTWGGDCPTDQIRKQATSSALNELRKGLIIYGSTTSLPAMPEQKRQAIVIGEPRVICVLVEKER